MAADTPRIAVVGAGSWGTALALQTARNGYRVALWAHRKAHVQALRNDHRNNRYLPDAPFPDNLIPEPDLGCCVAAALTVIVAVPSHSFSSTIRMLGESGMAPEATLAWATKGLEHGTGRFLHEVVDEYLGTRRAAAVVSGPSFAAEVAAGLPTAITVAARRKSIARRVAAQLHGRSMRAYTSTDVVGVELGGTAKNVIAIAAGISDGLGFGANARAALITRGLAEIVRLGIAVGGRPSTLTGLAGLGDLVLTCTDDKSRNRRFGLALGRGMDAEAAREQIGQVVEGADAAAEVLRLGTHHGVELPITEQVDAVLHGGRPPRVAVEALLAREPRAEFE